MNSDQNIDQLQRELQHAIAAQKHSEELLEKREKLIHQIEEFSRLSPEEQDNIAQMKQQLRTLDHALDELEHAGEQDIDALREALAKRLAAHSPERGQSYTDSVANLSKATRDLKNTQELQKQCHTLLSHGERALATSQQIWRGGFLGFILGANPNKIILRSLEGMSSSGKRALELLVDMPSLRSNSSLAPALQTWVSLAQAPWTYRTLRAKLPPLLITLQEAVKCLDPALIAAQRNLDTAGNARNTQLGVEHD